MKWKKSDSQACIYCKWHVHNSIHLLWECTQLSYVWQIIGHVIDSSIDYRTLIWGKDGCKGSNRIISLVCYIIFKKYLQDKDRQERNHQPVAHFLKTELIFRLEIYKSTKMSEKDEKLLMELISILGN